MLSGSVARRYARAVLLIGEQNHNYDILASEIDRLATTYEKSADLRAILENPAFSQTQRQAVLDEISRRLMLSKTVHNFAALLLAWVASNAAGFAFHRWVERPVLRRRTT